MTDAQGDAKDEFRATPPVRPAAERNALPVIAYATPVGDDLGAPRLAGALVWAVLFSVIVNVYYLGFLDRGARSARCLVASGVFWAATTVYLALRRGRLTRLGAAAIALGFPPLAWAAIVASEWFGR